LIGLIGLSGVVALETKKIVTKIKEEKDLIHEKKSA
jgi:hypothetical protein